MSIKNQDLQKAIEDVEQTFVKSEGEQTMDEILKTIKKLGKDGLKKAIPTLTDAQKVLLQEVLTKAKDMTKEANMNDNKKPQKAREPLTEEKSNSEDGVDESDEKLMDDKNKSQNHQGGPDGGTEGWKGEVIKSEMSKDEAKEKLMAMEEKEHKTKNPKKLVEAEKKEQEDKKEMKKSDEEIAADLEKMLPELDDADLEKGYEGFKAVEEKAKESGAKDPAAVAASVGRKKYGEKRFDQMIQAGKPGGKKGKPAVKKSEEKKEEEKMEKSELMKKMVEGMRQRGMERSKCMDALKKKGYDHEMADKLWEDQEKMDKAAKDNKAEVEEAGKKVDTDKKGKEVKGQEKKPMAKSIPWRDPQAELLGARTNGRNANYAVSEEIIKSQTRRDELKKSNDTFFDGVSESLEKSANKKMSINEMLEKGLDRSQGQMDDSQQVSKKSGAYTVSSFSEEDFIKAYAPKKQAEMKKLSPKKEEKEDKKEDAKEDKE